MTGHADTIRRNLLIKALGNYTQSSADDSWDLIHRWDALVVENQQLRDALAEIVAMYERGEGRRKTAAMVARAVLAGTPSEDT